MSINISTPISATSLNQNSPVEFKGTVSTDIVKLKFYSPVGNRNYLLGTTHVVGSQWSFSYQFNTSGNRKVVIDGLDATGTEVDEAIVDFTLVNRSTDSTAKLVLTAPSDQAILDLDSTVEIKGTAIDDITQVSLRSPFGGKNYPLGTAPVIAGRWIVSYKFSRGGVRRVIIDGLDASATKIATISTEIQLKSSASPSDLFDGRGWVGIENTTQEFKNKVVAIAERLGVKPLYLMAVMSFETGGTFSARIQNSLSGATGLIQFMPFTARSLGTSIDSLTRMKPIEQLDYVEKYFRPYAGQLDSLEDVYMAVLWPAAVGKGRDAVLFSRGSIEYTQNQPLDLNNNGHITAGEAASLVRSRIIG